MIRPINSSSLSFKRVYRYPYANYTQKQIESYDYVLDNVLLSKKYANKKGKTLEEEFNKLGIDVVAYPADNGGITFETKNSGAPFETLEEVNKQYPNVTHVSCSSEEQIADMFKTKLDTCKKTISSATKEIGWIVGGIATMLLGGLALIGAYSHSPKTQDKIIEKTIMQQDSIKTAAKDTIELFKK